MRIDICDVLAVIALMAISGTTGWQLARVHFEREAVKSGHAEYVTDESGEPIWRMKEAGQ